MINQPLSIRLDFSDIHSFGELNPLSKKSQSTGVNLSGIYIWGFVFDKGHRGEPVGTPKSYTNGFVFNMEEHVFIPYYVGQRQGKIHTRLLEHQRDAEKKYLILDVEYLKCFFSDCDFPIHLRDGMDKHRTWFQANPAYFSTRIKYYNSKPILDEIYHLHPSGSSSLQVLNRAYTTDSLIAALRPINPNLAIQLDVFFSSYFKDKQFFTYANYNGQKADYNLLEAQVYYQLKGKTISKHDDFEKLVQEKIGRNIHVNISPSALASYLFKPNAGHWFPGY